MNNYCFNELLDTRKAQNMVRQLILKKFNDENTLIRDTNCHIRETPRMFYKMKCEITYMSPTLNCPKPMYDYKTAFFTAGFPASDNFCM